MGWSASARMLPRASLTVLVMLSAACSSDDPKGDGLVEVDSGSVVSGDTVPPAARLDGGIITHLDATAPAAPATSPDAAPGVMTTPIGNPASGTPGQGPAVGTTPLSDGGVPVVVTPLPSDGNRRSVCYTDKPCAKDLFCSAPTGGTTQYPGTCTDGCRTDSNCPVIDGIPQICSTDGQCRVDCGGEDKMGKGACPANEVCRDVRTSAFGESIWRCTYPDKSGSRDAPAYAPCSSQHAGDCAGTNVCHVPATSFQAPIPITVESSTIGYCTGECMMAMDCLAPAGTTAAPVCAGGRCEFDCGAAGANTCPDKMNCRDLSNNTLTPLYRCVFLQ